MSVGRTGKVTNWDDDIAAVRTNDERMAQWGEIPGEITSFNPTTQTATIKPLYKPKFNGKPVDMPELLEVPVRFARGGNGGITYPIVVGDRVTLRPQMRSSENYHTDNDGTASDARSFNLSDMEAHLDGGQSLTDPIQNFDANNVHMRFDKGGTFGIRGSAEGKLSIIGAQGNVLELLAQALETLSIEMSVDPITGPEPLQHQSVYAELAAKLRGMML